MSNALHLSPLGGNEPKPLSPCKTARANTFACGGTGGLVGPPPPPNGYKQRPHAWEHSPKGHKLAHTTL